MTQAIGSRPPRAAPAHDASAGTRRNVRVWLFGGLAALMPVRPASLSVPCGATVESIIANLGCTLGAGFLGQVFEAPGRMRCTCRVFLDGLPVESGERLPPGEATSDLELIVLTAAEGG